jgi:hypothetical protein
VKGVDAASLAVVEGLLTVAAQAQKLNDAWQTVGVCGNVEAGLVGVGAAGQLCSFTTPEGAGQSVSLSGSVGLIGPTLGVSVTGFISNAKYAEAFNGDFACIGGNISYEVAAVCGGLKGDHLSGVYQVFKGAGVALGAGNIGSVVFSEGYTWSQVDSRPRFTPSVDPIGAAGEFSADLFAFTLGLSSGFCIFVCLEAGFSGEGPYIRPGVGFAVDSPGIVFDNANPQCGTEASIAYASVAFGPAQLTGGAARPGRSGDWESFGGPSIGLPDGGATPHYKLVSVGAGVKHEWTFC